MSAGRSNNFDALRLIAALAVLLSHMAPLSGRREWLWMGEHSAGNLGVLVFFAISGYLVTASWKADPDLGRFLAKRYLRMFPGLVVAMAATWALVRAFGLDGFQGNPTHEMNGSLWTIPLEVYCYLLLAAAGMVTARAALVLAIGMLAAFGVLGAAYLPYFGLFFAGGALLREFPGFRSTWATFLFAAGGVVVFLASGNTILALALAVPPLTVWVGTRSWPVLRSAGSAGDLSYGVYVYAWPMQQVVVALMPQGSSYAALSAVSLGVVLVLAWLSWRFVERPALARKPLRGLRLPDLDVGADRETGAAGVHQGNAGDVRGGRGAHL